VLPVGRPCGWCGCNGDIADLAPVSPSVACTQRRVEPPSATVMASWRRSGYQTGFAPGPSRRAPVPSARITTTFGVDRRGSPRVHLPGRNLRTVGGPGGAVVVDLVVGELDDVRAVRVDDEDLGCPADRIGERTDEREPTTIGRPGKLFAVDQVRFATSTASASVRSGPTVTMTLPAPPASSRTKAISPLRTGANHGSPSRLTDAAYPSMTPSRTRNHG